MQVVAGAKVISEVKTLKDYTSLILRFSSVSQHGWQELQEPPHDWITHDLTKSYKQVQIPSQIANDHGEACSKSHFSHVNDENHMFFLRPFSALGIYKVTYTQS